MRHVLAHGHIFKNAGSTLDWSLERVFGNGFLDHRDDKAMRKNKGDEVVSILKRDQALRAFSSHNLHSELPEIEGVQITPIFLLRHPVLRIASVYRFERQQQADTPGAISAKQMDFKEYVAWRMDMEVPPTIRNFQCRYLAGMLGTKPRQPLQPEHLDQALKIIRTNACIGVVENYDQSMVVIEQCLAGAFPDIDLAYIPQNTTEEKSGATEQERVAKILDQLGELVPTVLTENAYDLALYQYAKQTLAARFAQLDKKTQRLNRFIERCQQLTQPQPPDL